MNSPGHLPQGSTDPGEHLRKAREGHGWSLTDVERQMRIKTSILQRLEKNPYGPILSGSYALSFLKQYANHLGVDLTPFREVLPTGDAFYNLSACGCLREHDEFVGSRPKEVGKAPPAARTGSSRSHAPAAFSDDMHFASAPPHAVIIEE